MFLKLTSSSDSYQLFNLNKIRYIRNHLDENGKIVGSELFEDKSASDSYRYPFIVKETINEIEMLINKQL